MLPDDLRALIPLIYAHVTPLRDFSARHELDVADSVVALFAAEQCQDNGIDLSGSKMLIGGGALPRALAREALELGLDVYGGYGMSETCTVLTLSGLMPKMNRRGFKRQVEMRCKGGRPLPLAQIRIVDSEMNDLPHDGKTSGELVARAPWLTHGYLKDPKNSEKLWEGGWLHMGDFATISLQSSQI
jgi:fatty-acyl-CoA synthase